MNESVATRDKSALSQSKEQANPLSGEPISFNNAQWYIRDNEHKSHKKGKGGPAKRWGHSSVLKDSRIFIYGGNGRHPRNIRHWQCFFELDLYEWDWTKYEATNKPPPVRDAHSGLLVGNDVYIYGGADGISPKNDNFFRYDLTSHTWETIRATGDIPEGREGHTACIIYGRYMVIYGGWSSNEVVLGDTHCFDIEKKKWIPVIKKSGTEPKPRESQASCTVRDNIYIFGGQGKEEKIGDVDYEVFFNDLFKLKIEIEGEKAYAVWEELKPSGPKPPKRGSHSMSAYKDRYLFIIGGEGYPKEFDEESPLGSNPKKQADVLKKHQRNEDEDELAVFSKSDVWYYDIELNVWNNLKIKNAKDFFPHMAHTANAWEDFIIIFGGFSTDNQNPHDEICILSLTGADPMKQSRVKRRRREPEESQAIVKPEIKAPAPVIAQQKIRTDICLVCKNKLTNTYKIADPVQKSPKKSESKDEDELPKPKILANLMAKSGPIITGAYLHTLSQLIGWPFAAIGLLIDNSLIRESSILMIDLIIKKPMQQSTTMRALPTSGGAIVEEIVTVKDEAKTLSTEAVKQESSDSKEQDDTPLIYLQCIDNGKIWNPEEFVDLIADHDAFPDDEQSLVGKTSTVTTTGKRDQQQQEEEKQSNLLNKQYAYNLKIGCLRLGNTVVIISRSNTYTCLGFICVQRMTNIHVPSSNSFLYVCWENSSGAYRTLNGDKTKQLIFSAIKDFVTESELTDMNTLIGTKVLVMNLKKVPIYKKEMNKIVQEYELIAVKNRMGGIEDIRVRTLDSELKKRLQPEALSQMLEFSFTTYLKLFFLEPIAELATKPKRSYEIQFNRKKIEFINFKKLVESKRDQHKGAFIEIDKPNMFQGVVGLLENFNGIFILFF
mgnify:FL=1